MRRGLAITELSITVVIAALVWVQGRAMEVLVPPDAVDDALITAAANGDGDALKRALRRGGNPTARDRSGGTALTSAALTGETEMIERLVELGVDVNVPNRFGATALMYAAGANHPAAVQILLKHGADPTIACRGRTAMDWAVERGAQQCLELLLEWEDDRPRSPGEMSR